MRARHASSESGVVLWSAALNGYELLEVGSAAETCGVAVLNALTAVAARGSAVVAVRVEAEVA